MNPAFQLDAPEAETLTAIAAFKVAVPRLSREQLEQAALDHYNLTRPKGTPLAEAIVGDFADQEKARVWIEQRCIEMLRTRIALIYPQLTELAKSCSSAVKAAVIDKIYSAISSAFPQLTQAAAQACARRKRQLAIPPQQPPTPTSAAGVQVDFELPEEDTQVELPKEEPGTLEQQETAPEEDVRPAIDLTVEQPPSAAAEHEAPAQGDQMPSGTADIDAEIRRLTTLAIQCLKDVRGQLVPAAAEANIATDTATIHGWAMAIFLTVTRKEFK